MFNMADKNWDHVITLEEFWPNALLACKSMGCIIGGDSANTMMKSDRINSMRDTKGPLKLEIGDHATDNEPFSDTAS